MDCSLNGVCTHNMCRCDPPWAGKACGVLTFQPLPKPSAAYGYNPNVTSWGGNAIFGNSDRMWHLYVSEIAGLHCGLTKWNSNSRVIHATAKTATGPYIKHGVALNVEAHNPHIIRWQNEFLLFHIGDGSRTRPVPNCTKPRSDIFGFSSSHRSLPSNSKTVVLHRSDSLDGPWTRANTTMPAPCNNPAPWVLTNGSLAVVCSGNSLQDRTWRLLMSDSNGLTGKWTSHEIFPGVSPPTVRPHKFWEDPDFWVDRRGHWHILSHCYVPHYDEGNDYVSGHLYSRDGVHWIEGTVEPYRHAVQYSDGSAGNFSTLERPKLVFGDDGRPTHLLNGASPRWPCESCGGCTSCKVTPGTDWTFTIVRKLAVNSSKLEL